MECFTHRDEPAVGFCKYCAKGLCRQCARDTDVGLVCSEACESQVRDLHQISRRALKVYGIGDNPTRGVPTQVAALALFAAGFGGFALYDNFFDQGQMVYFFGFFGVIFALGALPEVPAAPDKHLMAA